MKCKKKKLKNIFKKKFTKVLTLQKYVHRACLLSNLNLKKNTHKIENNNTFQEILPLFLIELGT